MRRADRSLAWALALGLAAGLAGCADATGWLGRPAPAPLPPAYCYPTLGDVDCYDRPDPQRHR